MRIGLQRACLVGKVDAHATGPVPVGPWRPVLALLLSLAAVAVSAGVLSSVALASLPDGRVYEQVSPANKTGNFVTSATVPPLEGYSAAAADGDAIVFLGSGAMGKAVSGAAGPYVARRPPSGWVTSAVTPPQQGVAESFGSPLTLVPSNDFSRFAFSAGHAYSPEQPLGPSGSVNLYRAENPFAAPSWLGMPTIPNAIPEPGENPEVNNYKIAGASGSLDTVYFTYPGTLVREDASRASHVGDGLGRANTAPWGFYDWSEGVLSAAGVLPDGTLDPFGAVPAALAGDNVFSRLSPQPWQAEDFNNEVAGDGSRAFFVSPDPLASAITNREDCEKEGPCSSAPPELYVRETASDGSKTTVLVSQSQLPGHVGEPAPDGPVSVTDAVRNAEALDSGYVYASVDGTRAFFASRDRLTVEAPESSEVKEYEFDLDTGSLTYLPGVVGPIVAASQDGSDFVFENTASEPREIELWHGGANGGQVTEIAQLPEPLEAREPYGRAIGVEARASVDGSVFAFDTNAPLPGGFNNQSGYGEVYRYDARGAELTCVSCPSAGVTPSGNAVISYDDAGGTNDKPKSTVDTRVLSSDGSRVFFDTPDPLVPQDHNGKRDVYEWEAGHVYLISSGAGSTDSFFLDNSESGGDVFFATADGLRPGDTDEVYDVYDARMPRLGDNPPPVAVPCEGDVCQGPPSVPQLLGALPSATFSGAGNVAPAPAAKPKVKLKPLTRAQKLAKALKACAKKPKKRRTACVKQARKRYGHTSKAAKSDRGGK